MTKGIRPQIESFLEGFHELIPPKFLTIFDDKVGMMDHHIPLSSTGLETEQTDGQTQADEGNTDRDGLNRVGLSRVGLN